MLRTPHPPRSFPPRPDALRQRERSRLSSPCCPLCRYAPLGHTPAKSARFHFRFSLFSKRNICVLLRTSGAEQPCKFRFLFTKKGKSRRPDIPQNLIRAVRINLELSVFCKDKLRAFILIDRKHKSSVWTQKRSCFSDRLLFFFYMHKGQRRINDVEAHVKAIRHKIPAKQSYIPHTRKMQARPFHGFLGDIDSDKTAAERRCSDRQPARPHSDFQNVRPRGERQQVQKRFAVPPIHISPQRRWIEHRIIPLVNQCIIIFGDLGNHTSSTSRFVP